MTSKKRRRRAAAQKRQRSADGRRPDAAEPARRHPTDVPAGRSPGILAPLVVRGASRGFTVLIIGYPLALFLFHRSSVMLNVALVLVTVAGPAAAGMVAGRADPGALHGGLAGTGAYVLTMPLGLLSGKGLTMRELFIGPVVAALAGATLGAFGTARRRRPRPGGGSHG